MHAETLREILYKRKIKFSHLAKALNVEPIVVTRWCQNKEDIPPYIGEFLQSFEYDPINFISFTKEWPKDYVERLINLYRTGSTAHQIAALLGKSTSSVEGKIDRLHLTKKGKWFDDKRYKILVPFEPKPLKEPPKKVRKFDSSEAWRCLADTCRHTKQPGFKFCAEHLTSPKNRRSNMSRPIGDIDMRGW